MLRNLENMKKLLTLCIVHQHPRVLLGMKKRGFGIGHWNGFGGKVEEGESIEEAAKREVKEEAGIDILNFEKIGIIEFLFENDPEMMEVHLFKAKDFIGEPSDSDEMSPKWFHVDEIPFMNMWPDDVHWMPLFLKGKKFKGRFLFDNPSTHKQRSVILEKNVEEVDII